MRALAATKRKHEARMSNIEQETSKDEVNPFCSCLRNSTFVIRPARCAVNRFHIEPAAPNWHGFRFVTKHFAGQAVFCGLSASGGVAFELLSSLRGRYRLRF